MPHVTATDWDCRTLGTVPKIRDQGQCGSCWDFGGCGVCTSALIKAGQIKLDDINLSEQMVLDCGRNGGCNGDNSSTVCDMCKTQGIADDSYGSYRASEGSCKPTNKLWKIKDWGFVAQESGVAPTQAIKDAMVKYGPIQVNLDAGVLGNGTGIIRGGGHSIDHAVMVVGWHDDASMSEGGYWIMRNSWGTSWGEQGYCRIAYGAGDVGDGALWAVAEGGPVPPPPPVPPIPPVPPVPPTPNGGDVFGYDWVNKVVTIPSGWTAASVTPDGETMLVQFLTELMNHPNTKAMTATDPVLESSRIAVIEHCNKCKANPGSLKFNFLAVFAASMKLFQDIAQKNIAALPGDFAALLAAFAQQGEKPLPAMPTLMPKGYKFSDQDLKDALEERRKPQGALPLYRHDGKRYVESRT